MGDPLRELPGILAEQNSISPRLDRPPARLQRILMWSLVIFGAAAYLAAATVHRFFAFHDVWSHPHNIDKSKTVGSLTVTVDGRNRSTSIWSKWQVCLPHLKYWVNSTVRQRWSELFVVCSDEWAYLHVLKSGGTTVAQQCGQLQPKDAHSKVYQTHKLFTFVRDPIDHFISGYKECAHRRLPKDFRFTGTDNSLLAWMGVADYPYTPYSKNWCAHHSSLQIEYLLYHRDGKSEPLRFLDSIKYIGDKNDMKGFFQTHNLPWNDTKIDSRSSPIKDKLRELRVENLSPMTVLSICDHVKIDYCFFDYDPPAICREMVRSFCQNVCAEGGWQGN